MTHKFEVNLIIQEDNDDFWNQFPDKNQKLKDMLTIALQQYGFTKFDLKMVKCLGELNHEILVES